MPRVKTFETEMVRGPRVTLDTADHWGRDMLRAVREALTDVGDLPHRVVFVRDGPAPDVSETHFVVRSLPFLEDSDRNRVFKSDLGRVLTAMRAVALFRVCIVEDHEGETLVANFEPHNRPGWVWRGELLRDAEGRASVGAESWVDRKLLKDLLPRSEVVKFDT